MVVSACACCTNTTPHSVSVVWVHNRTHWTTLPHTSPFESAALHCCARALSLYTHRLASSHTKPLAEREKTPQAAATTSSPATSTLSSKYTTHLCAQSMTAQLFLGTAMRGECAVQRGHATDPPTTTAVDWRNSAAPRFQVHGRHQTTRTPSSATSAICETKRTTRETRRSIIACTRSHTTHETTTTARCNRWVRRQSAAP